MKCVVCSTKFFFQNFGEPIQRFGNLVDIDQISQYHQNCYRKTSTAANRLDKTCQHMITIFIANCTVSVTKFLFQNNHLKFRSLPKVGWYCHPTIHLLEQPKLWTLVALNQLIETCHQIAKISTWWLGMSSTKFILLNFHVKSESRLRIGWCFYVSICQESAMNFYCDESTRDHIKILWFNYENILCNFFNKVLFFFYNFNECSYLWCS